MNREDAEEYTQSLGQIVAGSWRQVALAKRLGVPEALGLDTEQWVHSRLGGYVRMSVPDRREAVKELTDEGLSQREVAEVLGVDQSQVSRDANASKETENPDATSISDASASSKFPGCTIKDLHTSVTEGRKFGCIYADPPWLYDNQGTRAATGNHYEGMTVDELCELPVRELAADACHLHLWTTNGFLFECPRLFDAWGFEFRSSFVWAKPQMGIGNYWRNSHEFLLTAIRGDAKRFNDKSLQSWMVAQRGLHSKKPEDIRKLVERASNGPYLELFSRSQAPGWTVWGNEVERDKFVEAAE